MRPTRSEVQQLVAEFMSSGIARSKFCQSRGSSFSTLDRHLKKRPLEENVGDRTGSVYAVSAILV
jgi:hypothetical protein